MRPRCQAQLDDGISIHVPHRLGRPHRSQLASCCSHAALPRASPVDHLVKRRRDQVLRTVPGPQRRALSLFHLRAGALAHGVEPRAPVLRVVLPAVELHGPVQPGPLAPRTVAPDGGGGAGAGRGGGGGLEEERPEGREAGAQDGGVELGQRPEGGGDVVPGRVLRLGGGAERRDADDGDDADAGFCHQ